MLYKISNESSKVDLFEWKNSDLATLEKYR